MPVSLLQGLRVVEIGHGIAGPLAGMLLAEHGADLLRVLHGDSAGDDPLLGAILARGKIEARLRWDQPDERETLLQLLATADVVIENDGPAGRLVPALDYEELRRTVNPRLISCRIAAFPDFDPRATLPGHEAIVGAAGHLYTKPLGRPRYHEFPIGSVMSALYAANAIAAALLAREELGRGQHVDTSLYHADLISQVLQIFVKAGVPRGFLALKMIGSPAMRCWECQDDRYVYLHITMPSHSTRLLELLDETGFAQEAAELRAVMSPETMADPSQVKSIAEAKRIKDILTRVFRRRPADDWEELLGKEICCIKVREVGDWLTDSLAAGMTDACRVEDPVFGELLGPGALVSSPEIATQLGPRDVSDQALAALRERWGSPVSSEPVAAVAAEPPGPPLRGIRVLDLSRIIAGPAATRVLAELGAEVVSLQSSSQLDWALSFHLVFNAGKQAVTLDFRSDAGKQRFWTAVEAFAPHVLVQNYRHLGIARAAGVDPEAVRARLPNVAYTHMNAYGDRGVWQHRPGFEQVVQAVSGIQLAYAKGGRPKLLPSPVIDIGCGLLGSFGTLLSLLHQRRTGQGVVVTTHLTSVAVLLQLPQVAALQRQACYQRARDQGVAIEEQPDDEVVAGVLSSWTASACLAGPRRDVRRWLEHAGLVRPGEELEGGELALLQRKFSRWSPAAWRRQIAAAGVDRSVALISYPSIGQLIEELARSDSRARPFLHRRDYPGSSQPLAFMRPPFDLSLSPLPELDAPQVRGADTQRFLARVGVEVPAEQGLIPYPPDKPFLVWLSSLIRWGYFAWRSGNI